MKKVIVIILITATIFSAISIFVFKPKPVKAFLGFGDIVADVLGWLKDFFLDRLPKIVARYAMVRLQQEITRWAQGGYTDQNEPFAMFNWGQEINAALNLASAKFLEEFHLTRLCAPLRFTLGTTLGFTTPFGFTSSYAPYTFYAACSLENVVSNLGEFWQNPSITVYGWDAWSALSRPENNIFGSVLLAAERMAELQDQEKEEKVLQKDTGGGYKNENQCIKYQDLSEEQLTECQQRCIMDNLCTVVNIPGGGTAYVDCILQCEQECQAKTSGICLEYKTKNLGSTIHSTIEKAVGSDIDWLISADEITQMFNLVFSKFFNKLIHGSGLTKQPIYRASQNIAKYQAQYGYQQAHKKAQTPEDIQNLRKDILENIRSAIRSATGTNYECNSDYQATGDTYSETATEIIDEEAQHLYTSVEGVNLKPDFQVLDPGGLIRAVGVVPLGRTWDDIIFANYPEECQRITGMRCQAFITNLPYELDMNNVNPECTTGCHARINDYRVACGNAFGSCLTNCTTDACRTDCQSAYNACETNAINQAVANGVCSSFAVGDACLQAGYLIDATKNRCAECVKKAQQICENQTDQAEKEACVELSCSNYQDYPSLASRIIDAQDFYNRCSRNELKSACYTCLKEYFMPAYYCDVIYDFVNRAFVNYPALVYDNLWWGMYNTQSGCTGNRTDTSAQVEVGLICRILPNYRGTFCQTACDVTADELKNIYDDEPNSSDCNPFSVGVRAFSPGSQYLPYLFKQKAKCCVALTNNLTTYAHCRGDVAGEQASCNYGLPFWQNPQCLCNEGERFLGFAKTSSAPWFRCPDSSGCWADITGLLINTCRKGCAEYGFTVPQMANINAVQVSTNAAPGGSITTVAPSGCGDTDESSCIAVVAAKMSLFNKLAKIFKPVMPFVGIPVAGAAGPCTCNVGANTCGAGRYCAEADPFRPISTCTPTSDYEGYCTRAGTCNCDNNPDCGSGQYCDTEAPANGECDAGQYTGLCKEGGATPGDCDYVGQAPNNPVPANPIIRDRFNDITNPLGAVCQVEVYNSTNSTDCCARVPTDRIAEIGNVTMTCDFSGFVGQQLFISTTSDDVSDCKTDSAICVRCDPSDPGYPNYGYSVDQCNNKVPPENR